MPLARDMFHVWLEGCFHAHAPLIPALPEKIAFCLGHVPIIVLFKDGFYHSCCRSASGQGPKRLSHPRRKARSARQMPKVRFCKRVNRVGFDHILPRGTGGVAHTPTVVETSDIFTGNAEQVTALHTHYARPHNCNLLRAASYSQRKDPDNNSRSRREFVSPTANFRTRTATVASLFVGVLRT